MKIKERIMIVCNLTKVIHRKELSRIAVGISLALALAGTSAPQWGQVSGTIERRRL